MAVGDVAPLPGFSSESLEDCALAARMLMWRLEQDMFSGLEEWENPHSAPHTSSMPDRPALWFGLATALADWRGKVRCQSLSRIIETNAARSIPINGLLAELEVDKLIERSEALWSAGYRSYKLKVANCDPDLDVLRISALCETLPDASIRLDANQGWDCEVARYVLSRVPHDQLEFIEEPLHPGNSKSAHSLCHELGLRLALDETADSLHVAQHLIDRRMCDVIVLKPMILGRWYQCHLLARAAMEAGIEVIYTSAWESDVGIAATLHLAAALGPNPPAMGLSTAGMISEGIVKTPLKIENGFLKVPEGPGLGIDLAPELLAQLNQS
jgi:o-succinylbenzoate synthase